MNLDRVLDEMEVKTYNRRFPKVNWIIRKPPDRTKDILNEYQASCLERPRKRIGNYRVNL